jgi:Ca-activated chloride channel family protein
VELAGQLEDRDRLTLVVLGNQTEIVIENAGRENVDRMVSAIQSLEPRQSPNLSAGLEMAIGAARRGAPDDRQHRLVLVVDGLADFNVQDTPRIEKLLADSAAAGVGVQVLDLGRDESPSETVTTFAQAAHAKFARPTSVEQLHWNMLETLTGRSSVVAKAASLKVVFNPETVASYRLLGHEATTVTGSNSAESQVELRADQSATALYEIVLKPGGGDNVATAELQWSDPITYKVEHRTQRISRLQFAKSLAEAPLSLQTAAVVAQTAEVLRGSYFVGSSRSLARVLELADQLAPQVREQPSVRGFLSLVAQAEKVRLYGPVLRKELRASGP